MVWGGVSQHHRTELVVIADNLNADMTLQHDNATSHTARSVREFLQERNVSVLPWPAKSPDLNRIEHVWYLLDWRELAGALVEEWGNISQQELANLVQTMRRRWTAVQLVATPDTDCYF